MAWNLDPNKVLAGWISEDKPAANNPRFERLLAAAKRYLKVELGKTDDWFENLFATNPDFIEEVNDVASAAIQRSWEADPAGRTNQSWSELGFSTSHSRATAGSILVGFTTEELNRLRAIAGEATLGRIKIISQIQRPNFNVSSGDDWARSDFDRIIDWGVL